jgi:hypothetical protein
MPRPCLICSRADRPLIEGAIDAGASDYRIAREFGIERTAVTRHRSRHMVRVEEDRLAILGRDRSARAERRAIAAAAASDEPPVSMLVESLLGLKAQAKKLDSIEQRLERMAVMSEQEKSASSVAQLSAQQLRSVEVGSRLAQTGGYAAPRNVGPSGEGSKFSITIVLGDGRDVKINATPVPQPAVVEGEISEESEGGE